MCDTFLVQGRLTASGRTTLAKNSDREPNEAQYLETFAAADHAPGSNVRCTYIEIPQVAHTHAMTGLRPWWMCLETYWRPAGSGGSFLGKAMCRSAR